MEYITAKTGFGTPHLKGTGPKRKVYALTPQEGVSGGDDGTQYTR
jgi:hypothetical protein